jgi:hypothetical protein
LNSRVLIARLAVVTNGAAGGGADAEAAGVAVEVAAFDEAAAGREGLQATTAGVAAAVTAEVGAADAVVAVAADVERRDLGSGFKDGVVDAAVVIRSTGAAAPAVAAAASWPVKPYD